MSDEALILLEACREKVAELASLEGKVWRMRPDAHYMLARKTGLPYPIAELYGVPVVEDVDAPFGCVVLGPVEVGA